MAHIFFERLERRRSTQALVGGLPEGWSGNSYPISRNVNMPISDFTQYYSPASYTSIYNGWNQSSNFLTGSGKYSPISNMNLYNNQATNFSISSLINNLFTPQQQHWNLEISGIGSVGHYQPRSWYPEVGGIGGLLPENITFYGFPVGVPPGIGHSTVGGIGRGISIYEWEQVGSGLYGIGSSGLYGGLPYPGGGLYYGIPIFMPIFDF